MNQYLPLTYFYIHIYITKYHGKITTSDTKTKQRHNPLLKDISSQGGNLRTVPRSSSSSSQKKKSSKKQRHNDEDDEESGGGEGF